MWRCRRRGILSVPYDAPKGLTWYWGETPSGTTTHFRCRCGAVVDGVDCGYAIDQNGVMSPDVYHRECGFHAFLRLEEWCLPGQRDPVLKVIEARSA